jgi:hypothetical protein
MTIAKFAAIWILDQIRKELTIQKPEAGSQPYVSSRKPVNKGDAAKGFMLLIIVPVMFCVLAILVL